MRVPPQRVGAETGVDHRLLGRTDQLTCRRAAEVGVLLAAFDPQPQGADRVGCRHRTERDLSVEAEVDVDPSPRREAEEEVLAVRIGAFQRTAVEQGCRVGEPALRAGQPQQLAATEPAAEVPGKPVQGVPFRHGGPAIAPGPV